MACGDIAQPIRRQGPCADAHPQAFCARCEFRPTRPLSYRNDRRDSPHYASYFAHRNGDAIT